MVGSRLRRDILMFAGGGLAILRAIERVGYDVFRARPKLDASSTMCGWDGMRCEARLRV